MNDSVKELFANTLGGVAGGTACVYVGQPLDTVKVKLQTRPDIYKNAVDCFFKTFREEGIYRGLYAGSIPALLAQVAENAALFAAYGVLRKVAVALTSCKKESDLGVLSNAFCGAGAGVVSSIALCPTELVKCRLQATQSNLGPYEVTKSILKVDGISGLFRGMIPTLAREVPGYFFFFGGYEFSKYFFNCDPNKSNALCSIVCGGIGGVSLWIAVFPTDVIKSRVQVDTSLNRGFLSTGIEIAKTEGFRSLYKGMRNTYVLIMLKLLLILIIFGFGKAERTLIFIRAQTLPGENVFIRGGLTDSSCLENKKQCKIPIRHNIRPANTESSYSKWSEGDLYLDWDGSEEGQGLFQGQEAGGTPMMWTTNQQDYPRVIEIDGSGYSTFNRFSSHYWFVDLEIDCSLTSNGWFDLKAYITPDRNWESDINQYQKCASSHGNFWKPHSMGNHVAVCGQMNVFILNQNESKCGKRNMFTEVNKDFSIPRIVGGKPAPIGRWPWQGVLQYGQTIGGCGAVLLSPYWAITAAHCLQPWDINLVKIRFGEMNLLATQGTEQVMSLSQIVRHPGYGNPGAGNPYNDNDVTLLRFAEPVKINEKVNSACLPFNYKLDDFVGEDCWATGFGATKGTSEKHRLNEINVPVHSHQSCISSWGLERITQRQLCVGTPALSACGGDSGGPLVCKMGDSWVLAGTTSWGDRTCQGKPSVYSRITEFLPWIQLVTGISK
ncbi:DgyrCDS3426 [Dimorphilus gyrociliatus]|uniref:DgyrCDS3426 n=1 Tax=Dimorphilus gyrociliatus TaxID=2664684 RepID=A0A7I8VD55_9ANNE|nr:DgyrCDS3426 [Dimorphilus gyrociliatus]